MHPLTLGVRELLHMCRMRAQEMALKSHRCSAVIKLTVLLSQLPQPALIKLHRISQHRSHNVVGAKLMPLRKLDGRQQIGNAGYTQLRQPRHQRIRHSSAGQQALPRRLIEQPRNRHRRHIIHRHHHIRIADVVNPRNVFIANAFDAVRTKTILNKCRALQGLTRHNLAVRELLL